MTSRENEQIDLVTAEQPDLAGAHIMDILTYRELEHKEDIFILWLKSFGWPGSAKWLANFTKYDTRIGAGPVGMCGLIKGQMVGFVGIMTIPTRTRHGEIENVGGIYAVAVRPSYMRRGIGRKLLEASEKYLQGQGIRLSFLTTSRSIVAYQWYCDVGYEVVGSVESYPYMYKILNPSKSVKKKGMSVEKHRIDLEQVQKLFGWYGSKHCGFVIRGLKDLRAREMEGVFSRNLSITVDGGYALLKRSFGVIQHMEILARSMKAYTELIKLAGSKAKYAAVAIHPFDPKANKAFEEAGYQVDLGNYGVLMYKRLSRTTFEDVYDDSFMISRLDLF